MQYKVKNNLCDMKLLRNGSLVVLKSNQEYTVSLQEYQYLAQVYGMSVKGDKDIDVRVTTPSKIEKFIDIPQSETQSEAQSVTKRRKHKKS